MMRTNGRRRAPRERASIGAISFGVAAVLIVGGAGVAVVFGATATPIVGQVDQAPSGTTEPVATTELVCPEPGASKDGAVRVAAANVAGLPGQDRPGAATIASIANRSAPIAELKSPGSTAAVDIVGESSLPLVIAGDGGLAPGLVGAQVGRDETSTGRGLSSSACVLPGTSWWFMSGGAEVGQITRVVLVNSEPAPAEVDVEVFGPNGPVELPSTRGIVMTSRSETVLRFDRLIPGVAAGAIHVIARSGRIAVSVSDSRSEGFIPKGVDFIPPASEPANTVWLPGVSDGSGARQLRLLAPSANAVVSLRVLTASGSFVPSGLTDIDVPQGKVVNVDVAGALRGDAATIKVESDQPVVAGLTQTYGLADVTESSYTAGSPVMTGASAVTGLPGGKAAQGSTRVVLWVTAPDGEAQVRVTLLPAVDGEPTPSRAGREFTIPAGRVVAIELKVPPLTEWFTALVTPLSGAVLVAHRVNEVSLDSNLVTGYPWRPLRVEVTLPAAREDIAVGMP
jgi:hypothetical protein